MKRKPLLALLAGVGAASSLAMTSCDDTYGMNEEPQDLLITRLTLLDNTSRTNPVFTDTSSPTNCKDPAQAGTDACMFDPNMDNFGVDKSPPTPFSDDQIRVVFNKLPLKLNGADLEMVSPPPGQPPASFKLTNDNVIGLQCTTAACGVPALVKTAQYTGSALSPDPTNFAYGPALQMVADTDTDPRAALEPSASYQVTVDKGVQGRNGAGVVLDSKAQKLLTFTTEPFQVIAVGNGSAGDAEVIGSATADGSAAKPYDAGNVASNGVVAIKLNAPIDESLFTTATAKLDGVDVPIKIGLSQVGKNPGTKLPECVAGSANVIYVFPAADKWGNGMGNLVITLKQAEIRDLSQLMGHPAGKGRNQLKGDLVVSAKLTGALADMKYTGLTNGTVATAAGCADLKMNQNSDGGTSDGSASDGGDNTGDAGQSDASTDGSADLKM